VGFGTDLKIMVSPVRIRVPPLKKSCKTKEKEEPPVAMPGLFVNSPFKKTPLPAHVSTGKHPVLAEFRVGNNLLVMRF
jgi:hypothetical protein